MYASESRPAGAASELIAASKSSVSQSTDDLGIAAPTDATQPVRADVPAGAVLVTPAKPERPRCVRCGHPLALPRSVARAYGAKCWRRTAVAQLDARRDTLGRVLGRLARRVAVLDAAGLDAAVVTL